MTSANKHLPSPPGAAEAIDLENQYVEDADTTTNGFLRFLDHFHPMGLPDGPVMIVSKTDIVRRRAASIILSILLVCFVGLPLRLISWVYTYESSSVGLIDDIISHSILAAACYFDLRISSLTRRTVIRTLPKPDRMGIRNGRLTKLETKPTTWRPEMFWPSVVRDLFVMGFVLGVEWYLEDVVLFRKLFAVALILERWRYMCLETGKGVPDEDEARKKTDVREGR